MEEIKGFLITKLEPVCQCVWAALLSVWCIDNIIPRHVQLHYPVLVTVMGKNRKDKAIHVLSIIGIPTEANVADGDSGHGIQTLGVPFWSYLSHQVKAQSFGKAEHVGL